MTNSFFDAKYEKYAGRLRWFVTHPAHKYQITVAAPDKNSAIVAAADYWGERWQDPQFHQYCTVNRAERNKK